MSLSRQWQVATKIISLRQSRGLSLKRISELTGADRDQVRSVLARAGLYQLPPSRVQRIRGGMAMDLGKLPDVEAVAAKVHEAWMAGKRAQGITTRPAEDGEEQMVPYEQLSEKAKEADRITVRTVYAALAELTGA